jgi:hypothetical protein
MVDVAYRFWSLIHRDLDPLQQEPTFPQPPMLATVAVDCGGSLHFELASSPAEVTIQLTVAGLSLEGRGDDFLHVFRGTVGAYSKAEVSWSRGQDGPIAVLTTSVTGAGDRLKLYLAEGAPVFVTTVSFSCQ